MIIINLNILYLRDKVQKILTYGNNLFEYNPS